MKQKRQTKKIKTKLTEKEIKVFNNTPLFKNFEKEFHEFEKSVDFNKEFEKLETMLKELDSETTFI